MTGNGDSHESYSKLAVMARPLRKSNDINAGGLSDEIHSPNRTSPAKRTARGIPITTKRVLKVNIIVMPPLTQTLGVLIEPINSKYVKKISKEKDIIAEL